MARFGSGDFTTGWEHLKNRTTMFLASLRTHILVTVISGLVIASIWFAVLQPTGTGKNILPFAYSAIISSIFDGKQSDYDVNNDGNSVRMTHELAYETLRKNYMKGRSFSVILFQYLYRFILVSLVIFLSLQAILVSFGKGLVATEKIRGTELYELDNYLNSEPKARRKLAIYAGISISIIVFYVSLGFDGMQFFGDYVWAAIYNTSDYIAEIASPDGVSRLAWFYEPEPGYRDKQEFYYWMRNTIYDGSSFTFYLLKLVATIGAGLAIAHLVYYKYFSDKKSKNNEQNKRLFDVAGLQLEDETECKGIVTTGSPGVGKSVLFKHILDQIRERGERAIIYDPAGEFIENYYREGTDIVFNPGDKRFSGWDLWSECKDDVDYEAMAASLFPIKSEKDEHWKLGASTIFTNIAKKLKETGENINSEFWRISSTQTVSQLNKMLAGTPAAAYLDPGSSESKSHRSTYMNGVRSWKYLPDTEQAKKISLTDFIRDESKDSWIFFSFNARQREAFRPLMSLWLDISVRAGLSLIPNNSLPKERKRRIFFLIDELPSLQFLPSIMPLTAEGRKFGLCPVFGFQSLPQLVETYGKNNAKSLCSNLQTWLVMRTPEPETSRWLSESLGSQEIAEVRKSTSHGKDAMRDGESFQEQEKEKRIVLPTEIAEMEPMTCFIKTVSEKNKIFRAKFDWKDRGKKNEIFIPKE